MASSYGVIRRTIIKGQAGTTWYVHLYKKDYTGAQLPMDLFGEGFDVKWSGSGGTRNRRFVESECVLNFIVQNNDDESLLYDVFEKGDRNYFVRIYKNEETTNGLWWFGWVHPSFSTVENSPFPYQSKISSTDSIGTFKKSPEADLTTAQFSNTSNINTHIKEFGDDMGVYQGWATNLVSNGFFSLPQSVWVFDSPLTWSIPTGGGQANVSAGVSGYMSQDNISVTQNQSVSFTFTVLNYNGTPNTLDLRNELGQDLSASISIDRDGTYVISFDSLQNSTGIRLQSSFGGSYSITNVTFVDGNVDTAPMPQITNWFYTSIDWWRNGDTYQSDDPFYLYRIGRTLFRDNVEEFPNKYSKYKVLDGALKVFNTVGVLSNGRYNFIQPNQYANNTSGDLRFYQYASGSSQDTASTNENHLLTLDGTTNADKGAVLGGSTLTYEPPFKSVSATFLNSSPLIIISPSADFTNYGFVGNIQEDPTSVNGSLNLSLNLWHEEKLLASEVLSGLNTDYDLANKSFKTTLTWNVRLTDGVQIKYLTQNSSPPYWTWEDTEPNNIRSVGYQSGSISNVNSDGGDSDLYPCKITYANGDDFYIARTSLVIYAFQVPLPPFTGSVHLKLSGVNEYYQWKPSTGGADFNGTYANFNNSLLTTIVHSNNYYWLSPPSNPNSTPSFSTITDYDSISINEDAQGVKYTSNNDNVVAEELFDFKDVVIGNTGSVNNSINNPTQANVQYLNSDGESVSAIGGFREGNSGTYKNVTQLLCNEFLSLQTEPLEILQADIFSPDISPLKLLKYSINDDANFKYYSFLGGSFSAQSETMKGEWFKINSSTSYTEEEDVIEPNSISIPDSNKSQIDNLTHIESSLTKENAIGLLVSDIDAGVSFDKFNVDGLSLGRVYDNQKLIIRNPYNGEYITVVVDGDQGAGVSSVKIDPLTPNNGFPIGSTLSVLTYDLSNVIQGGSSNAPQTDKIDITSAQYQALGSTPQILVAAPGVGKVAVIISVNVFAKRSTTETSSVDVYIGDDTSTTSGQYYAYVRDFMNNNTTSRPYAFEPNSGEIGKNTLENRRLQMYSNGLLNGDISLTVYVTYQIMDI